MILNALLSIVVGGMLGHAVDAGYNGRLAQYINSPESYAIKLFSPEVIAKGKGGWQGEHAGKWMYAAAKAYERTGDPAVLARLTSVADYLVSRQEKDGYLGCYREDKRYYHRPSPEAMTVDWDTWIMAYLIKGFTEAGVATGNERYLDCAQRIAGFIHWTVFEQGIKIAQTGQHSGMAGCGMLDPLCDLYLQRPVKEVKELIDRCIFELDDTPCLQLITLACKDYDVSLIGNGKIYEMNRCLTGMAKAYQLFGDERLLKACTNAWESIRANHLTTLGGPWGGINYCWEIFNRVAEWAPYECTETCSVMEWMHFSWEMLKITGDGKYASEIEKSSYNALMAARAEDGLRWEYYVRTNGEMTPRGDWACCWSSGMTSLEDLPVYMYDTRKDGIYVNIIGESSYETAVRGKQVKVQQISDYARTGKAEYVINGQGGFTLAIHNPEWATSCKASINGKDVKVKVKNGYGLNYLIPQGKAIVATPSAKKVLAENLKQRAHKLAKIKADAEELAAKLNAVSLTIPTKANKETGAIYGSVTNIQIAEALEKAGYNVDRKIISVKESVKSIGEYVAVARLHKEVSAEVKFSVVAE